MGLKKFKRSPTPDTASRWGGGGAGDGGMAGDDTDPGDDAGAFSVRRQLPAPAAGWENKVVLDRSTRKEYICQNEQFVTTDPTATWAPLTAYYTSGDANLTIFNRHFPQVGASDVGRYYYDSYDNTFYKVIEPSTGNYDFQHIGAGEALVEVCHAYYAANEGGELQGDDMTPVLYIGEYHDDDSTLSILAQHTIDLTMEYVVFMNFISGEFEILTAYTPAGTPIDHFVWNPAKAEAFNPILRPNQGGLFPEPTEDMFIQHAVLIDNFGHGYGVQSVLHPGEEERAVFAQILSSPSDSAATRGYENPPAWAVGVAYKVGDRVNAGSGGSIAVCVQDHTSTSTGATSNPDNDPSGVDAYWTVDSWSARIQVPNRSHFRGVYSRSSDVSSPQVGNWIAIPRDASGHVAFQRYTHTGGPLFGSTGWFTYHPYSRVLGAFQSEADAIRAIHSFDENVRTIAIINGALRELTYFVEHTADTHAYEWVPSRPTGNPVAVFYGAAMTATGGRFQDAAAGNKEDEGTDDRLLRWHETARESYFHGNALNFEFHAAADVTGEDITATNDDILFSPEPGLYHVEIAAGSGAITTGQADVFLGLFQVMSGTGDDQARALVTPGWSALDEHYGEPDTLDVVATTQRRFLQVNEGDVFFALLAGVNANTSQYMLWEKLD